MSSERSLQIAKDVVHKWHVEQFSVSESVPEDLADLERRIAQALDDFSTGNLTDKQ